MAFLTAMSNSFGARWFDDGWRPQFDQPEWKDTLAGFYVDMMKADGPEGASNNGFNENLALFQQGKGGMWIDATVASLDGHQARTRRLPTRSASHLPPDKGLGKRGNWLWAWSLAVPAGSQKVLKAAEKFISWATSQALSRCRGGQGRLGQRTAPGTRTSLYANPDYQKAGAVPQDDARLDQLG